MMMDPLQRNDTLVASAAADLVNEAEEEAQQQEDEDATTITSNSNNNDLSTTRKRKLDGSKDPNMELTAEEKRWAIRTKEAFEEDDEILASAFSDMEIACFAIIDQGDIERSIERAICMQAYKMQYNINDTVEEGIALFRRQEEICPGMWLSVEECPNDDNLGSYVCVFDLSKYYPLRFLQNPRNFRVNIGSIYYTTLCTQPDFKGLRDGYRHVFECHNVTWQNMSFKTELRTIDELISNMPYRRKTVKLLRAPNIVLIILNMMKPFFPKHEIDAHSYGSPELQQEFPQPISEFYRQPDPQRSFEKVMMRTRRLLQKRFDNNKSFRLELD